MTSTATYERLESLSRKEVESLTRRPEYIRNVSVLAAGFAGHRRSYLSTLFDDQRPTPRDQLPSQGPEGDMNHTLAKQVILSLRVGFAHSTQYGRPNKEENYLINLVDDPDRPSYPEAAALSLRITDGAIIIVDCQIGISSQIEGLLKTALLERNKVTVVIDGIQSLFCRPDRTRESIYEILAAQVGEINEIIKDSIHSHGHEQIDLAKGNVVLASLRHGWALSLPHFAAEYSITFGLDWQAVTEGIWGDSFFDNDTKMPSDKQEHLRKTLEQDFDKFIVQPIYKIYDAVQGSLEERQSLLATYDIKLNHSERQLGPEDLFRTILRKILPASDAVLRMICLYSPSPVLAQSYRGESLYQGPLDDEIGIGIATCDEGSPLMIYISRAIPTFENKCFYLLGRVFLGTVNPVQKVRVVQGHSVCGEQSTVAGVRVLTGYTGLSLSSISAGNIVGIAATGLEETANVCLTTFDKARNLRSMNFWDKAAIYVNVDVEFPEDLPKLISSFRLLTRANPYLVYSVAETGEHELAAFDEVQLQNAVQKLIEMLDGIRIKVSQILWHYREGIKTKSGKICMARSPNKHNRLYAKATPLSDSFTDEIDSGLIHAQGDWKRRSNYLAERLSWDKMSARRVWCFGPNNDGSNVLVDSTAGVQYLNEIKDSAVHGFQWAMKEGHLCQEPMRSVRIDILDVMMMSDAIHRGSGQVIPTIRRVIYGSVLLAKPCLYEPVYQIEIYVPRALLETVYQLIESRKGRVFEEKSRPGEPIQSLRGYVQVNQSLGLQEIISSATGGAALCSLWFAQWRELEGDVETTVLGIRQRKGLPMEMPSWKTASVLSLISIERRI
ncbi:hypothetical protein BDV12DRAFT_200471 [Aspergillus spectabilis]